MSTPATIWLVLSLFNLGLSLEKGGKPVTGNHSFASQFIVWVITACLLEWGGFFDKVAP